MIYSRSWRDLYPARVSAKCFRRADLAMRARRRPSVLIVSLLVACMSLLIAFGLVLLPSSSGPKKPQVKDPGKQEHETNAPGTLTNAILAEHRNPSVPQKGSPTQKGSENSSNQPTVVVRPPAAKPPEGSGDRAAEADRDQSLKKPANSGRVPTQL